MTFNAYCEAHSIRVILSDSLPVSVAGCCYHDEDGNNFILLNAKHTKEKLRKTAIHELKHIIRGDMYNMSYKEY